MPWKSTARRGPWCRNGPGITAVVPQVGLAGGIAAGVNAKKLSTIMGHASIVITFDRFGHLMPGSESEAAPLVDAYLERSDAGARLARLGAGA